MDLSILHNIFAYDRAHPLLFNTGLFMFLFVAFLLVYQGMRRWHNFKMVFVILFSLYFYYKSTAEFCFILLGVCLSDYLLGLLMGSLRGHRALQKCVVALNVVMNVGMLVYFKYFNVLYDTFANFTGRDFDALDIILPVGMSFFTFRSISYIVDIYRGQMEPARNLLQYTFYMTFFPVLLQGPVVRAKDMLPQVAANPVATRAMVSEAMFLIIAGLIKKVVVADYLGDSFVNRIFENPSLYTGLENMLGAVGFSFQLYCDFSGYSDIALGIALLLGFRLKDNFNSPFKSLSPTEFWKRWHISLSSWLMDYIYIPLGGNRKGPRRQKVNLMTTMLLGGIWHGETLMYLIWGGYNGALLVGHKMLAPKRKKGQPRPPTPMPQRALYILITFVLICIGFMFFRAPSIETVGEMFTAIFTNFHADVLPQFVEGYFMVAVILLAAIVLHYVPDKGWAALRRGYAWMPLALQVLILALALFLVVQMRNADLVPFIYMQY